MQEKPGRIRMTRDILIPVHILYSPLIEPQRNIVLQVYCLSCDTTSFLYLQGENKPFMILGKGRAVLIKIGHNMNILCVG